MGTCVSDRDKKEIGDEKESLENQIFEEYNIINQQRLNLQKNINLKEMKKFAELGQKAICKIKIFGGYGSGFFCKIPDLNKLDNSNLLLYCLVTNFHVLNNEFLDEKQKIELEINNNSVTIPLDNERKIWMNKDMDYTIIEIKKSDNIDSFLDYDEKINTDDFNNKEYKEASILLPTFMKSGEIETDKGSVVLISNNSFIFHHTCNTDPGSSGGPIILIDNFTVIGIHKGYDKKNNKNVGIFLYNILKNMKEEKSLYKK